jgi:hypothetical protein
MKKKPGRNDSCPCGSGRKYKKCHLLKTGNGQFNRRFNRWERADSHDYNSHFGTAKPGEHHHQGWIKCRLLHSDFGSVILPDFLFIDEGTRWIQPLAFHACTLIKDDEDISCRIYIDISGGQQVEVKFKSSGFAARLADGSEMFRCSIRGPHDLAEHATGLSEFRGDHRAFLKLYHHTNETAKTSIVHGRSFRASTWNIQGTKRLTNVGYVYLTPLDQIKYIQDLERIGMASNGQLHFLRDGVHPPPVMTPSWKSQHQDDILTMSVYRANTEDRTHTIEVLVEASALAPVHVYRHKDHRGFRFYEVSNPWINRVGLPPSELLRFSDSLVIENSPDLRRFEYVVIGDATTLAGLSAPYDEEDTTQIFKLEKVETASNQLEFWFANGNKDLFSGKNVDLQKFSR